MILPDGQLFQRQAQQFASEGKSVDEITIAEMRGKADVYPTKPLVLGGGRTVFGKLGGGGVRGNVAKRYRNFSLRTSGD